MLTEKQLTDKNAGAADAAPVFTNKMYVNTVVYCDIISYVADCYVIELYFDNSGGNSETVSWEQYGCRTA